MSQAEQLFWAQRSIDTHERIQKRLSNSIVALESTVQTQDQLIRALYKQIERMEENFRLRIQLEEEKRTILETQLNKIMTENQEK